MTYEEVLSNLKTRLMVRPGEKGPHVRALEIGASYIVNVPYHREDYHASEITAGMMIKAMWVSEPRAASTRDWPTFRIGAWDSVVADGPIGMGDDPANVAFWGGHLVAIGLPEKLRDFVIAACNAYRDTGKPGCQDAGTSEPDPFGWYAGPDLKKLAIGPFATRDEAVAAFRADHAAEGFYLVEGRRLVSRMRPFRPRASSTGAVLDKIDADAARDGAVLPRLTSDHEWGLADMLNAAVEAWGRKHGIKLIGTGIEARAVEWVPEIIKRSFPFDDVIAAKNVLGWTRVALSYAIEAGEPVRVEAERAAVARAQDAVASAQYRREAARGPVSVLDPQSGKRVTLDFPPNPPARPHTGDMRAMLDDIGRIDLSGLRAAEAQGWDGATVSPVS